MARLIPPVRELRDIENVGERVVAEALLEQLPDDVVVYHSYPWLRLERHSRTDAEYLQPGEADFVIVDPRWGLLVLEVKGSEIEYEPGTHEWRQKNRGGRSWHSIEPFRQAERNKHAIVDRLEAHRVFKGSPPFTTGHAVVFTEARLEGRLPADIDTAIVLDAASIRIMKRSVDRAFERWCRVQNPRPLTDELRGAILESLSPIFRLVPVLWRTLDHQEERLHRMTQNQELILQMLHSTPRAAIEGVAGSGKTLLAVAQAQRLAREGKRTLLCCYNRPLAEWIARNLPESYRSQIDVQTFHGLCLRFCTLAGLPFAGKGGPDFWTYEAPEALMSAADVVANEHGYDAIVVDEAQDFADFWWMALEKLYRDDVEPKPLTVFLDPRQCIYQERPLLPADVAGPYHLPTNCRNTRRIAGYCAENLGFEAVVHPDAPEGADPQLSKAADLAAVIEHTRRVVQNWCLEERGGLSPAQVAILTPWDNHGEWPERFGNLKLVRDFDAWSAGAGVLLATHRRFKGLEADALVLAGVPEPGSTRYYSAADHYVASSRAKHLLEVVRL
ncbi:MAG: NERD domain-containing protein [Myxococcales bacterium]|nr:NERD domain-containing protein [Myxococcales bacterium]